MKVLYEEKLLEISDLPIGEYLIKSSRFLHPTMPLVDRDGLKERIDELGYMQDKIEVQGPFNFLHLVLGER